MAHVITGPDTQVRLSDDYVRLVARDAFFWAWPIVNVCSRRGAFARLPHQMLLGGVLPVGPANTLTMLTDYVSPSQRAVACPNQDVVYGHAIVALDVSPVVVQVPDFGSRFWFIQVLDSRTDSFAELGSMYGTPPGFYLLAGPNWVGAVPKGIQKVFVSQTSTGVVIPRVFREDTPEDLQAVQAVINQIGLYPVEAFDGRMKFMDWRQVPVSPQAQETDVNGSETRWVRPEKFLDMLPIALADARPLPGEAARYAQVLAVAEAARNDQRLKAVFNEAVAAAERELVDPLFQFRNFGRPLPHHWSTIANGACFGTDYFMRTAVAKSNIFVSKQNETKYFYQDLDADGNRLNSAHRYTVTFAAGQTPPVRGFWSLSLYNRHHFFAANALSRFSVGTKSPTLRYAADGSLTILVQAALPDAAREGNWLPAPPDGASDFSLCIRLYWPEGSVLEGRWTPPAVLRQHASE
ncbi:DUF1254 domain-containing protein [Variovorax ureilyticus]|uniref:DUF1254 domain-containing protein n=1 Tax=Variovorax ureilyticus TaxID=1836198 RepID=A0ABU8VBE8_9BURK